MKIRQVLIFVIVFFLMGCSTRHGDPRLDEIAEMVSDRPEEALARLDSIDSSDLSEGDRHFYDFLTIKGRDKAYIFHTSDSLILDVLEWYERHDSKGYYPEALYYGGRVYSDLGDSPTALRYFQQALDAIPEDTGDKKLRATVLSQTGRLLNSLKLYNEAIPYVKRSIKMDSVVKDPINMLYDLQLLGAIYFHQRDLRKAKLIFDSARKIALEFSPEDIVPLDVYLAAIDYRENRLVSARNRIYGTSERIDSIDRSFALSYAAEIYMKSGMLDSALTCAYELTSDKSSYNKSFGLRILLSPEFKNIIGKDSLYSYIDQYKSLVAKEQNQNANEAAFLQNSLYNYRLHERERIKAEKSRRLYVYIAGFTCLIGLLMAIYILLMKVRKQKHIIELRRALEVITILKNELENNGSLDLPEAKEVEFQGFPDNDLEALRQRLRDELMRLYECSERQPISPIILNSDVYQRLQKMIDENIPLLDSDPLWKEIEDVVLESSPNFIQNLNILTLGKLTSIDLRTALLIKCDIRPVHMSLLMSKSNGAIVSRRMELGVKIFDKKIGVKVVDGIIRLL